MLRLGRVNPFPALLLDTCMAAHPGNHRDNRDLRVRHPDLRRARHQIGHQIGRLIMQLHQNLDRILG